MHHVICGIIYVLRSIIPSTSFCSLSSWFTILRASPQHSHHLRSHHLSLPRPFTPDLKLISFTNPFLYILSGSIWTVFTDCFFLVTCARLSWSHSAFQSTLNSCIVWYRIALVHFSHFSFIFVFVLCILSHFTAWMGSVNWTDLNSRSGSGLRLRLSSLITCRL